MRAWRVALIAVVVAAGCSDPKYAFDDGAVRSRIEERTGLTGDPLDEMGDEVRRICKITDLQTFETALRPREISADQDDGASYNDVVHGCPRRFD